MQRLTVTLVLAAAAAFASSTPAAAQSVGYCEWQGPDDVEYEFFDEGSCAGTATMDWVMEGGSEALPCECMVEGGGTYCECGPTGYCEWPETTDVSDLYDAWSCVSDADTGWISEDSTAAGTTSYDREELVRHLGDMCLERLSEVLDEGSMD